MSKFLLSPHFTLAEATTSRMAVAHSIDNTPDNDTFEVMLKTAASMETVRDVLLAAPMHINSWYRCPALNKLVGSKPTSQHTKGEAVDWSCPRVGKPAEVCKILIDNKDIIKFDQLILEHSWIHISFAILSNKPRGQVLSLLSSGGYANGLTTPYGIPIN